MREEKSRAEEICMLLKRTVNRLSRFQEQGRSAPGAMSAGVMLSSLSGRKEVNQRELVSMMQIRSASVSEILHKLEEDGLVRRRTDPRDRRNTLVSLTGKGRRKEEEATERRRRIAESMMQPLSEEEQELMLSLLRKMVAGYLEQEDVYGEIGERPKEP